MKLQTQNKEARPSRVTKKANGEYNVRYTSYRYTQPKYMNGVIAPAMISAFSGQLISDYLNGLGSISKWVAISIIGFMFASVIFMISYLIVLRPSLLDGGMRLTYHASPIRALPLGFISWTGVWMFILNFPGIFSFLRESYLNDVILAVAPAIIFLCIYYVLNWLTLMVGGTDIFRMKQKAASVWDSILSRTPYTLPKDDPKPNLSGTWSKEAHVEPTVERKSKTEPQSQDKPIVHKATSRPTPKAKMDNMPGVVRKRPR